MPGINPISAGIGSRIGSGIKDFIKNRVLSEPNKPDLSDMNTWEVKQGMMPIDPSGINFMRNIMRMRLPSMSVADDSIGMVNASGESAASGEALGRMADMARQGKQFSVRNRAGNIRKLIGPEAVDYIPQFGEEFGTVGKQGFDLLQSGNNIPKGWVGR